MKISRVLLLFVVCCLVLILVPSIPANGQGRREINGTGVGSDILVPGEPEPEREIIVVPTAVIPTPEPAPQPVEPKQSTSEPAVSQPMPEPAPPIQEPYQPEEVATSLPATAGELPLLALFGFLAVAGAGSLRLATRKSSR
jgi:hypothetical protein